jgi:hypothetical protein
MVFHAKSVTIRYLPDSNHLPLMPNFLHGGLMLIAKILLVAFSLLLQHKLFPENNSDQGIELTSYPLPHEHPEYVLAQRAMLGSGLCPTKIKEEFSDSLPPSSSKSATQIAPDADLTALCF